MSLRRLGASLAVSVVCVSAHAASYVVPPDLQMVERSHAVVVARAINSYVEQSDQRGIETVTVLSVDDVLKGGVALHTELKVRVPGGVIDGHYRIIFGAPRIADGERALLFLRKLPGGDYAVTDFGLGLFGFSTDDNGHRVLIRTATEINGWNPDGTVHHEPRRDEERFLEFIRSAVRREIAATDYTIETRPLLGDVADPVHGRLRLVSNVVFTATQYTLPSDTENTSGFRWNVFPSAVNLNRGNAATGGVPNSGIDAINTAFTAWNGEASSNINYVLASSIVNLLGITDAADSVNNIVFEKDLTGAGAPNYTCGGGVLGLGGISNGTGTHSFNSETFFSNVEVDVSMNKGVGACVPGSFSVANYNSALTHEVGHTLGLRHSDKTRDNSALCTTNPAYDCSSSAIMTASVTNGINATLQAWDIRAVQALYGSVGSPPAAPTSVVATATSGTSVSITWTASAGATSYEVYRRAAGGSYTLIASPATNSQTDNAAVANNAYMYRVRAVSAGGTSVDSAANLATTVVYTDPTLTAGIVVKAVHLSQLRTAVSAVRLQASLSAGTFTDSASVGVMIKAVHINELRTQLDAAMSALGLTTGGFTDTITATSTPVKAVHQQELRTRMQ